MNVDEIASKALQIHQKNRAILDFYGCEKYLKNGNLAEC